MKITKITECTRVPVRNMERATLANRCIIIEADKRFKETDIKQIFSNVVQLTALKKETTTDDDDEIQWILRFTTVYGK